MPIAALEELQKLQTDLIRKTIGGSVFVGPIATALLETLTAVEGTGPTMRIGLNPLPDGMDDLGYMTDDGMAFATETNESTITSFQSTIPTRSDITSETSTLTVTAQETKLLTLSLYTGADPTGLKASATTGELRVDKPMRPSSRFYRVLSLAVDGSGDDEIYIARYFPRAKITGKGEQGYSKTDQALVWPVTFTGYHDSEAGTSESYFFGGPGFFKRLAAMGIETA